MAKSKISKDSRNFLEDKELLDPLNACAYKSLHSSYENKNTSQLLRYIDTLKCENRDLKAAFMTAMGIYVTVKNDLDISKEREVSSDEKCKEYEDLYTEYFNKYKSAVDKISQLESEKRK